MHGALYLRLLVPCCAIVLAARSQTVEREADVLKDFERRVADYVKLHNSVRSRMDGRLKTTPSAEVIRRHERILAAGIRESRADARRGDIFTPEIAQRIRELVSEAMRGPQAARIRLSLKHAAPVQLAAIRINAAYPDGIPLQSTPPSLLLNLPKLPPVLDYRVIGRRLVLRDVEANLIVDYIPDAIP